jgi:CRP-like cAMP-binding protein
MLIFLNVRFVILYLTWISMNTLNLAQRLQKIEHFQNISLQEIKGIISAGNILTYPKDHYIFTENEPSSGMYVLLKGQVQLCKISLQGQVSILSVIDPVIMFNEVSALDGGQNPTTAITIQESVLWHITSEKLQNLILQYPHIGLGLLKVLANRNRKLISLFQDLSFRPLLSRTAKLLLEISDNGKQNIFRKEYPNYQLAARISTVPEAFSRCLKTFRNQNMIRTDSNKIEILDPQELKKTAMLDLNN